MHLSQDLNHWLIFPLHLPPVAQCGHVCIFDNLFERQLESMKLLIDEEGFVQKALGCITKKEMENQVWCLKGRSSFKKYLQSYSSWGVDRSLMYAFSRSKNSGANLLAGASNRSNQKWEKRATMTRRSLRPEDYEENCKQCLPSGGRLPCSSLSKEKISTERIVNHMYLMNNQEQRTKQKYYITKQKNSTTKQEEAEQNTLWQELVLLKRFANCYIRKRLEIPDRKVGINRFAHR